LFSLRDQGDTYSVEVVCEGLKDKSALFRHEVAYVLGQMQHDAAIESLRVVLENTKEQGMVRHEAAEALGAISSPETMKLLKFFVHDPEDVVRESCEIALDIHEYYTTDQFQYADGLMK